MEQETLYVCRYCQKADQSGMYYKYQDYPVDLNAICQQCDNEHWHELYDHHYRAKFENDENLENFIKNKGYCLQKNAILSNQSLMGSSWSQFNELHNKLWKLIPKISKKQQKVLWLTLNPKQNDINKLKQIIKNILKTSNINKYCYVYEWRDHDKETGLHCHMLLDGNLGKITQHINRQNITECRIDPCKTNTPGDYKVPKTWWNDKIQYMTAQTQDSEKNAKKEKDKILRKKYNLLNIYRN